MTRIDYVYKICTKQEWDSLKQKKSWDGSKSDIEDEPHSDVQYESRSDFCQIKFKKENV